ncbi:Lethal(2)denticleless protein [Clohesyomyces aquaticus]|uniref:Lethal(2)denticleless protein n=1 Tax=Clohesyomyces aquaticus TaxID=1231657 RepID=A0A1Y1ZZ57_9PLEO|nr:Lethal(2)denticleless protein [Clohesyomyces aquaticus]
MEHLIHSSPRSACHNDLQDPISDLLCSSPPLHGASTTGSRKPKKPPPITPKRFTRFFTPRSSVHGSSHANSLRRSGRQLQDITQMAINRRPNALRKTPSKTVNFVDIMPAQQPETPKINSRKRKTPYLSPESSPAFSSPSKRSRLAASPTFTILEDPVVPPAPIKCIRSQGRSTRILQRSGAGEFHQLPQGAPPFCTASCHTNSLVAVGDEDGWVHLLDTDDDTTADFTKSHVSFSAHKNAVMDVQFSSDDLYLATASGDQTGQIIDVRTQQCVHVLAKHTSSVKQVRFQPGDDKIIATSSRDGTVQIWDLRCSSGAEVVHSVWGENAPYASTIRTLSAAHADSAFVGGNGSATASKSIRETLGKSEAFSRRGDISVTALSFLPSGREHLLLTASDASTCIKLWDIRGRYSRRGPALPISTTRQPESHNRHRHFAINSLTLNGDGSRLYALSKDNTVYAYATSHLVLGSAPELAITDSSRAKHLAAGKEGLGPIYGFRHRNFHAGSFYVKASLRKARGDQPELLAVGSTDGCPVLFPTDETLLRRERPVEEEDADELPQVKPSRSSMTTRQTSLSRKSTGSGFSSLLTDTIPIYEHGTPLIRGHDAEVTSVAWTRDGALVSVADDFSVRCWRQGSEARALRLSGEGEGRRWRCGWAAVEDGFDEDD